MGYAIELTDPVTGDVIELGYKHHISGGTYALFGSSGLSLSVTYNYARFYYPIFGDKGIRFLYGKTGAETIPHLEEGMKLLADDVTDDYWEATEGNAKRVLAQLLAFAQLRPDGIWNGD